MQNTSGFLSHLIVPDFLDRISLSFLPTVDNLHNFLLTTTTEVPSFFQQLLEAP